MRGKFNDLTGKRFGRLTVIGLHGKDKNGYLMWDCVCDCGNEVVTRGSNLVQTTRSCGCLQKERHYQSLKKYNEYEIIDNVAHVKLHNTGNIMLCDADDWEKSKQHCWHENSRDHYAFTTIDGKKVKFNNYIIEKKDGYVCDHINHNRIDNRRCNLRYATSKVNAINVLISKKNKSGHSGVCFVSATQKWRAYIYDNSRMIYLGEYENKEDAIKVREEAEKKYYNPIIEKETLPTE